MTDWKAEAERLADLAQEGGSIQAELEDYARRCIAHGARMAGSDLGTHTIAFSESGGVRWAMRRIQRFADAIERGEVEV